MKYLLILCGLLSIAGGCRGGGGNELLERELRLQEDRLFQLQDALDQCQAMLDASRRENEAIKKEIATGDQGAVPESGVPGNIAEPTVEFPGDDEPASRISPPRRPSPRRRPASAPDDMPELQSPIIEPGIPADPEEVPAIPSEDAPRRRALGRGASLSVTDKHIVKIVLNRQLTGGLSHDGRRGDEGVMVVFEPRNAAGQLVATPGDVSIVVIDPALTGAAARIARWDFTSDEVSTHFRQSPLGKGLHFELPWPSQPPVNSKLQLFVRYVTTDGRKLSADQPIDTDRIDRQAKSWKQSAAKARQPSKPGLTKRAKASERDAAGSLAGKKSDAPVGSTAKARAAGGRKSPAVSRLTLTPEPEAEAVDEVIRIPEPGEVEPPRAIVAGAADALPLASESPPIARPAARDAAPRNVESVSERPVWKPFR